MPVVELHSIIGKSLYVARKQGLWVGLYGDDGRFLRKRFAGELIGVPTDIEQRDKLYFKFGGIGSVGSAYFTEIREGVFDLDKLREQGVPIGLDEVKKYTKEVEDKHASESIGSRIERLFSVASSNLFVVAAIAVTAFLLIQKRK